MEDDDDFITRSARGDFTSRVSAKTNNNQEFISLQVYTAVIVEQVRKRLKDLVIKANEIEYQVPKIRIATDVASSFRLATKAFLIADGFPAIHVNAAVNTVLDRHREQLLKHSFATLIEFHEVYKRTQQSYPSQLPQPLGQPTPKTQSDYLVTTIPSQSNSSQHNPLSAPWLM
jgi:hypothetical protein